MSEHSHFEGKDAIGHVAQAQARGIVSASEIHGTEIPGHIAAGADAAREMAVVLILLETLLHIFPLTVHSHLSLITIFALGWTLWKTGRSAWLGWFRLERLHRVLKQEKWEIEHNRQQEREELGVLYQAKGFEGKLLEDVLDVLMADGDRLLRVMVEEELGLSLENQEHPLKQGLGAALGCVLAFLAGFIGIFLNLPFGGLLTELATIAVASAALAQYARNAILPAVVWNLGLAILAYGTVYFLADYVFPHGLAL